MNINLILGDITKQEVDAIVNAANNTLLSGGGVDGAIHRAAGDNLLAECRKLGGCETGAAKITKAYNLPAKYVIHTVGPVYNGGQHGENDLLFNCYANSMKLAEDYNIKSIAFPCISTGAYQFPFEKACEIALRAIQSFQGQTPVKNVFLVCHNERDYSIYQRKYDNFMS